MNDEIEKKNQERYFLYINYILDSLLVI